MSDTNRDATIAEIESWIGTSQYKITKKYDGVKGICTVMLVSRDGLTVVTDANRSRSDFGRAYRSALLFAWNQIKNLEATK